MTTETITSTLETFMDNGKAIAMSDVVSGKIKQTRGHIQEKWGDLTADRTTRLNGRRDQILGLLQEKYGYTRLEASRFLDEFIGDAFAERAQAAVAKAATLADRKVGVLSLAGTALLASAAILLWRSRREEEAGD